MRKWILEFVISFNTEDQHAIEGQTQIEADEEHLKVASSGIEEVSVVDTKAGWYENEQSADKVGQDEMCEKTVGLVAIIEAAKLEKSNQKCEIDYKADDQVNATNN